MKNRLFLNCFILIVFLFLFCLNAKSIDPTIIKEFENSLKTDLLDPYYPAAEDTRGGFIEERSGTWQNKQDLTKYIVAQGRYLWMASKAAEFYKNDNLKSQTYRSAALHGFEFLKKIWGFDYDGIKGFPITFDNDGNNGQITGLSTPVYGNAFGLYGTSAYYGLTGDAQARVLAGDAYRFLIKYAYDSVYKGFFSSATDRDKNIDINMHVLEGMVEFYQALPANDMLKDSVKQSVTELLGVIHDKVIRDIGQGNFCAIPVTDETYTRASNLVSFGHDVELGFLMIEAMKATGIFSLTHPYMDKIKKMVDFSLNGKAFKSDGAIYYEGTYNNGVLTITNTVLEWWPQAEVLNTLCLFSSLYPQETTYETKFWLTWNCIKNHFIDPVNHGWAEKYDNWGASKATEYHCNYHNGRALINCIGLLRTSPVTKVIQAESYSSMFGIQTETTTDVGGGLNAGWIATGDWMTYTVAVPSTGTYSVDFRIAGWATTGKIELQNSAFVKLTGTDVPNTGGYQVWKTVSGTNSFNLTEGLQTFRIYASGAPWNINWFELKLVAPSELASITISPSSASLNVGSSQQFTAVGKDQYGNVMAISPAPVWTASGGTINAAGLFTAGNVTGKYSLSAQSGTIIGIREVDVINIPLPDKIEAENYSSMYGIQTEATSDAGGGLNVGWIAVGDWMTYTVTIAQSGTYSANFRVAGWAATGSFAFQNASNSTLTTVTVPNGGTGAYQVWSTVAGKNTFQLTAGTQTFRIYASGAPWNINWFDLKLVAPSVLTSITVTPSPASVISGSNQQFTAVGKDQYGNEMVTVPSWSVSGGGTIGASTGLFTSTTVGGLYTVRASEGTISGTASFVVIPMSSDPFTLSNFLIVDKWTGDYMMPKDGLATAVITQFESSAIPTSIACQWEFRAATTDGYYYILNKSTGKAIQPTGGSMADNVGVSQVTLTALNQNNTELQWALQVSDEPAYYWIKNRKSGLNIRPAAGANGTGIAIVQNTLNSTYSSFKWSLVSQGLKSADIQSNTKEISSTGFKIYPNPAKGMVAVETGNNSFNTVEICSVSGVLMMIAPVSGDVIKMDISVLNKGLYLVTLRGNKKSITQKLIIQ